MPGLVRHGWQAWTGAGNKVSNRFGAVCATDLCGSPISLLWQACTRSSRSSAATRECSGSCP